ncbi:MAG: ribonuclease HII [Actinomycetota bacterium]|nr:ribonuclease HII [Actinomycetota bacterium]
MIENKIWLKNKNQFVIGADEVGRGSFAGPIVAAAVKINKSHEYLLTEVKDSKKLSEKKRKEIFDLISINKITYSISECPNTIIDEIGISEANKMVLENSIEEIYTGNEKVYVDHFKINKFSSVSLVRGEDNSKAIALASIIAKVYRDNLMVRYSSEFPQYLFEKNKGYGTQAHREIINKYGLTKIHRKSFNLMPS